ncbi:MAG TPA: AraC family transcriptional regulator [Saprospiraceae bacterium]|nr:AraC family transcriptional regulator [Saprospiraceae bacterium]
MRTFTFEKRKYGFELLMDLHRFENNPNIFFDSAPHTTDFFEMMTFEKASGIIELNGRTFEVVPHSFFFICPFQKKSCRVRTDGVKGFHLVFQNDFLADFFDDKLFAYRLQYFYNYQHPQYLALKKEDYDSVGFALNEIIVEIKAYQSDSPHIIRSLLYFTLSKLNRLYSKYYGIPPGTPSESMIYKFKEMLEQHIRSLHAVKEYCVLLQTSRHQLNSVVKAHTGLTTREMINNRLLQEIKTELRYSDKTIAEIAYTLNFSEPNNLTRFFKKMEGVSPSVYRGNYQIDSL